MTGQFTHINEEFTCAYCGQFVPKAKTGCRNHCPYCLCSKHVDINPGDRAESCQGQLAPIGYETNSKKGIVLIFKCKKCGMERRNKAILKDPVPDQYDIILKVKSLGD
jgi:hypothetical protein